jgi:hypothetical protein
MSGNNGLREGRQAKQRSQGPANDPPVGHPEDSLDQG